MQRSPFADTMIAHLESASKALKAGDYAKADELISAAQVVVGIDGVGATIELQQIGGRI